MTKKLLFFAALSVCSLAYGFKSAFADGNTNIKNAASTVQKPTATPTRTNKPAPKIERPKDNAQTANYKGVSFNYNPQIFVKVDSEIVEEQPLESADDKPDDVHPAYTTFHLKYKTGEREATISVFPIAEYRRMYAVSKETMESFDENINNLQKALKDEKFRLGDSVPIVPAYDASQTITARVKHIAFQNGGGIVFLTQFDQGINLVNNDRLAYFYQGITADGKNYVLAEFAASAAFLPKDEEVDESEGYKLPKANAAYNEKAYMEYLAKVTKKLENLPADEFEPSLKAFDEIIASLKIER